MKESPPSEGKGIIMSVEEGVCGSSREKSNIANHAAVVAAARLPETAYRSAQRNTYQYPLEEQSPLRNVQTKRIVQNIFDRIEIFER
jgi:hypothetical protein